MTLLRRHATGAALLEHGGELLRRRETLHSLILMLATRPVDPAALPPYYATVEDERGVALVVLRTPPHNLVLSALREDADAAAALDCVVSDFSGRGDELPGVSGHAETVLAFAPRWEAARSGICARVLLRLAAFELDRVIPPRATDGRLRKAVAPDLEGVFDWCNRFVDETGLPAEDRPRREALAARIERGAIYLWEVDGVAVTMAVTATGAVARIGGVFTPSDRRGRGYASACVAAVSQELLDAGASKVTLSADVANPTSNKIYEALGYRRIGDEIMIELEPGRPIAR